MREIEYKYLTLMKSDFEEIDPWESLAYGIVFQAIQDYRTNYKKYLKFKKLYEELQDDKYFDMMNIAGKELYMLGKFFKGDWFECLCDLNGDYIMEKLRERIDADE